MSSKPVKVSQHGVQRRKEEEVRRHFLCDLSPDLAQKRVLGTRQAATFAGLSVRDWERKRAAGETPAAVNLGTRKLGYQVVDLLAWIESRKQQTAA
jgi:predicted DNA-binding transcriptional regulator AlpA